jgi:hypothetical protein
MWLIIDYARDVPSSRWWILGVCVVLAWAGDVAVLTEASGALEWGACGGLVAAACLIWLCRRTRVMATSG